MTMNLLLPLPHLAGHGKTNVTYDCNREYTEHINMNIERENDSENSIIQSWIISLKNNFKPITISDFEMLKIMKMPNSI